jgi:hypothetical protein
MTKDLASSAIGKPSATRSGFSLRRRLRYRGGETSLRAPFIWWRHRGLGPNDVFIAAYPRSGYTWLRFLLFEIIAGRSAQFRELDVVIPYVTRHAQAAALLPTNGRLIATHETHRREYKRAIYLVRDVRDVAVSEFLREQAKGLAGTFDQYLDQFLAGEKRHGSWAGHLSSWLDSQTAREGKLHVIKYEDLHQRPIETLEAVTNFLGVEADRERIATALAGNTVEQMRTKEDISGVTFKGEGDDGRFVRKGTVEGWRDRLTKAQVEAIEIHSQAALLRMGYPVSSQAK